MVHSDAFASAWRYGELAAMARREPNNAAYLDAMSDLASLVAAVTPEQDYRVA